MLSRRKFLQQQATLLTGAYLFPGMLTDNVADEIIMTVNGPISPADLKFALIHEHVMVDFIGADKITKDRYNADEVYTIALPFLQQIKEKGCHALVECTPAYLGRDPKLLQRLSKASGLHIITNTGFYGAAGEKYLPKFIYTETAEQIAARWIDEWKNGIEGTGIKPGFIKTGVDKAPLSETQRKIIDAAAITHLATGLRIGVHTGNGDAANEQLDILKVRNVPASARIWIHAQNEPDTSYHIAAAKKGSWVSLDGVHPKSIDTYINYLNVLKGEGLLANVLVSQDSGWYHVGEANGGEYNNYNSIFTHFIPALKKNGFTQKEIEQVFVTNPAKAFTLKNF